MPDGEYPSSEPRSPFGVCRLGMASIPATVRYAVLRHCVARGLVFCGNSTPVVIDFPSMVRRCDTAVSG
jgi:hypothetical protein